MGKINQLDIFGKQTYRCVQYLGIYSTLVFLQFKSVKIFRLVELLIGHVIFSICQFHYDTGNIALYAYHLSTPGVDTDDWQSPYRQVLACDAKLAEKIADALNLNLEPDGLQFLRPMLPPEPDSYLSAASFLLYRSDAVTGLELLRAGEKLRRQKIARLWSALKEATAGADLSNSKDFRELTHLDRNHPGVLLLSGDHKGALQQIDRQGEKIGSCEDTQTIGHYPRSELDQDRGDLSQ